MSNTRDRNSRGNDDSGEREPAQPKAPFYARAEWLCIATLCIALLALLGVRMADIRPLLAIPAQAAEAPPAPAPPRPVVTP